MTVPIQSNSFFSLRLSIMKVGIGLQLANLLTLLTASTCAFKFIENVPVSLKEK